MSGCKNITVMSIMPSYLFLFFKETKKIKSTDKKNEIDSSQKQKRVDEKIKMNVKTLCVCMLLLFATAMPVSIVFANKNGYNYDQMSMTYSFEKPLLEKVKIGTNIYDQVTLQNTPCTGNPGEPSLPARGANILLPQKTKVERITVTYDERIYLGIGYNILPVGEPIPLSEMISASLPVPDETIYDSGDLFPGELFTTVGTYGFRGYEILVLMLHPVQYIPSTGALFYYPELMVSVETVKTNHINSLFRGLEQDKQKALRKVDNPSVADTYTERIESTSAEDNYDLLIITTDELEDVFGVLKDVHDGDGIDTVVKTLAEIGCNTPEDIRRYIRFAYINKGIEYVLIGGDDDLVPVKDLYVEAWPGGKIEYHMPSDFYYACLDGTFNYDGDDYWGEPTDGENGSDVDLIAEIFVGRACVGNSSEADHFVSKTIAYMNIDFDDSYLKDVVMVGEYLGFGGIAQWGGNYLDELISGSSNHGYTTVGISSDDYNISTLYDRDWPDNHWPLSEIIGYINNGTHIINHLGHGSPYYAMKMDTADADDLVNDKYCFVYSQTCSAGHFDKTDCFAEHLNVKTDHGAYAVIMNARYGWGLRYSTDGPSQRFHREFWDAMFGENMSMISKANQDSKEDNLWRINEACMRWCYYELNLFGDPTLTLKIMPVLEIGNISGGLFKISTVIKNIAPVDANGVNWSITLDGGFILLGKETINTIESIPGKEEKIVSSGLILGFGNPVVTVRAEIPNVTTDTKNVDAFVLLFFIKI